MTLFLSVKSTVPGHSAHCMFHFPLLFFDRINTVKCLELTSHVRAEQGLEILAFSRAHSLLTFSHCIKKKRQKKLKGETGCLERALILYISS